MTEKPPPLRDGERLSRSEFDRRYDATPELKKAERIEGVVVLAHPTCFRRHGKPHSHLTGWLFAYEAATPGVETGGTRSAAHAKFVDALKRAR